MTNAPLSPGISAEKICPLARSPQFFAALNGGVASKQRQFLGVKRAVQHASHPISGRAGTGSSIPRARVCAADPRRGVQPPGAQTRQQKTLWALVASPAGPLIALHVYVVGPFAAGF